MSQPDLHDLRRKVLEREEVSDEELYQALEALAERRGGKKQGGSSGPATAVDPNSIIDQGKTT